MSHQDDLEIDYKSVSNEMPSDLSDQIILQAAHDAVTPEKASINVVKGKFSSRRWHMPVSLAAAAVITVSVVSSLQPWQIIPESSPVPLMSQEPEAEALVEEMYFDSASVSSAESDDAHLRQETLSLAKDKTEQKSERNAFKKRAKAIENIEQMARKRIQTASAPQAQTQEVEAYIETELFDDAKPAVLTEIQLMAAPPMIKSLTILEWLTEIENHVKNKENIMVREKMLLLKKQHNLESFSEKEQARFDIIQTYLTAQ